MNKELTVEQNMVLYAVGENIKRLEALVTKMEAQAVLHLSWYHKSISQETSSSEMKDLVAYVLDDFPDELICYSGSFYTHMTKCPGCKNVSEDWVSDEEFESKTGHKKDCEYIKRKEAKNSLLKWTKTPVLKTYQINSFSGHYLGGCAVVVAENQEQAFQLLKAELDSRMLLGRNADLKVEDMVEVNTSLPMVDILFDGNY